MNYIRVDKLLKIYQDSSNFSHAITDLQNKDKEIKLTGFIPLEKVWKILGFQSLEVLRLFNISNFTEQEYEFLEVRKFILLSFIVGLPILEREAFSQPPLNTPDQHLITLSHDLLRESERFLFKKDFFDQESRKIGVSKTIIMKWHADRINQIKHNLRNELNLKIEAKEFQTIAFTVGSLATMVANGDTFSFLKTIQNMCSKSEFEKTLAIALTNAENLFLPKEKYLNH